MINKTFILIWGLTSLIIPSSAAVFSTSIITQYGVTWTFDRAYDCGQFVNGDYWVVGPVTITSITPAYNGNYNGWEINPLNTSSQGFDSRIYDFNASLVPVLPCTVNPGSSVVKSRSDTAATNGNDGYLITAAVLTVVSSIPQNDGENYFRPPYFGNEKPYYSISSIQTDLLPSIPPVGTHVPTLDYVKENFQRVWLDHKSGWTGRAMHPQENLPAYGGSIALLTGDAALALMVSQEGDKMPALINFLQAGIDLFHIMKNGGEWGADGGHNNGRKLPIILAAVLLNNQEMKDSILNAIYGTFQEDGHLYYSPIANNGKGMVLFGSSNSEGGYWNNQVTDNGSRTSRDPYGFIDGGPVPGTSYQAGINSMIWKGPVLAMQFMPLIRTIWNNDCFLEYTDRWVQFGAWAQPDPVAPPDMTDTDLSDYGRTYGPNGQGGYIADTNPADGIGRHPEAHGTNADTGIYESGFVNEMWQTYRVAEYDFTIPTQPQNLSAQTVSASQINLTWNASTDKDPFTVTGYEIYRNSEFLTLLTENINSNTIHFSDTELSSGVTYSYQVLAYDSSGNKSQKSSMISSITQARPVIVSMAPLIKYEGEKIEFDIQVTDVNVSDAISIINTVLPQGSSITSTETSRIWRFSWQTDFDDAGSYSITFKANDGHADSDSVTVNLAVTDVHTELGLRDYKEWN